MQLCDVFAHLLHTIYWNKDVKLDLLGCTLTVLFRAAISSVSVHLVFKTLSLSYNVAVISNKLISNSTLTLDTVKYCLICKYKSVNYKKQSFTKIFRFIYL